MSGSSMELSSRDHGRIITASAVLSPGRNDRIYATSEPGQQLPDGPEPPVARSHTTLQPQHLIFNRSRFNRSVMDQAFISPSTARSPFVSSPNVSLPHASLISSLHSQHFPNAPAYQRPTSNQSGSSVPASSSLSHAQSPQVGPTSPVPPVLTRRSPTIPLPAHPLNSPEALSYITGRSNNHSPHLPAPVARAPIPILNNRIATPANLSLQHSFHSPINNQLPPPPQYEPSHSFIRQQPPHFIAPSANVSPIHPVIPIHNQQLMGSPIPAPQDVPIFPHTPPNLPFHHVQIPFNPLLSRPPSVLIQPAHVSFPRSPSIFHPGHVVQTRSRPTFPSTRDVPILNGRSNWGSWHTAVVHLIQNQGFYPHISDGPVAGAPYDPSMIPTLPPPLSPHSDLNERTVYEDWWAADGVTSFILDSRLSDAVINTLPTHNPMYGRRTARQLYLILRQLYSIGDYSSAHAIEMKLRNLSCAESTITSYITEWRIGHNQMVAAGYPMDHRSAIMAFLHGLPRNRTFDNLREDVLMSLDDLDALHLPPIEVIFERVRKLEDLHRTLRPASNSRRTNNSRQSSSLTPANTSTPTSPATRPLCTNCGGVHLTANCFQPGGAMEGKKDEVLANRRNRAQPQAHLADIPENVEEQEAQDSIVAEDLTTLNDNFAALCVNQPLQSEIDFDTAYALPAISKSTDSFPMPEENIDWVLLTPRLPHVNTALDSGCTTHLFRDRELFWNYNSTITTKVGTANCGEMETLGRGEVRARIPIQVSDGHIVNVTWIMRDCLHAPMIPFHLLSVGQMTESGMTVSFAPGRITTIFFPDDIKRMGAIANRSFEADTVLHRISFLNLTFILPTTETPSIPSIAAFPAYPTTALTSDLWHRRLGHPGQDVTRIMLTRDIVDGITWTGPLTDDHCVPCIIGKSPQTVYASNKNRADQICELIHVDTSGPYPVQTPQHQSFFFAMLDDCSNFAGLELMVKKNEAVSIWKKETASWQNISGRKVKAIRVDGAKELIAGSFAQHLHETGVTIQQTAPYAHQQNGKIERYIRTISDTAQSLMAGSGLPPSFWGYAVRTARYLRNRLPTKTLLLDQTPHERMKGSKPDLSHLRVWGCTCFVHIPEEKREKGGPRRFEAIFVGYEEDRIGWLVRDMNGKHFFSRDVIFDESRLGHLSTKRVTTKVNETANKRILRSNSRTTSLLSIVQDCVQRSPTSLSPLQNIDSASLLVTLSDFNELLSTNSGNVDRLNSFTLSSFSQDLDFIFEHCHLTTNRFPFRFRLQDYNPDKPPESYNEVLARPDKDVWWAAMMREKESLEHREAFERVTPIPKGRKPIGVRWTYTFKFHPDGSIRRGEEKARLVAQGFSQREGIDFGATYAPVVKFQSVRILLAFANFHDLEIMSFDVKTAFLHAKLSYDIYTKQIPGFPEDDKNTVLRLLVALYGLRQSAYEFYQLLLKLLLRMGLSRSDLDHAVFFGIWHASPDPSITMPQNGSSLLLIIPVHVDDGMGITNSIALYQWFIATIMKDLEVVDMGPVSLYLGNRITRDRKKRKLWISQKPMIYDLLQNWEMLDCTPAKVPLNQPLHKLPEPQTNSLPNIEDKDILINYQRIVGSLIYLSICTRPDIAYAAMALGQYNACPTKAHLLAAKGVLRYLKGTMDYGLEFSANEPASPESVSPFTKGCALSDADWASDETDRKSISGYCFYYYGCLVSWSASKQKVIASSSTEAEYYSMSYALREAIWIQLFLTSINLPMSKPFPILCDNQSALNIANSDSNSSRTKHIDVRYHFIREKINDGTIETTWIPTADMTADIFTKPLAFPLFAKHRQSLGVVEVP